MKYDAIIIGSGQAGNPLAAALTTKGWRVLLVEREHLGGTCVNTGCTPTKTLVHRALIAHHVRSAPKYGVHPGGLKIDYPVIKAQKDGVVKEWQDGVRESLEGVTVVAGPAHFTAPHEIAVGLDTYESEHIFINTGGEPIIPRIAGLESVSYLTNETILELTEPPEHLLVLGGGYVGLEFAQMMRRFGSRVTVIHNGDRILPREDPEISDSISRALSGEGVDFRLNVAVTGAGSENDGLSLAFGDGRDCAGSHLLIATGRRPRTADLDLDKAGVTSRPDGSIMVNDKLETSVPGIWALGDVKGGPAFTHISYNDFQIVYSNLVEGADLSIKNRIVPYAVYTDPEVGAVGITETEARKQGKQLKVGCIPLSSVARAVENGETEGLMKVVIDAGTDQILGARIVCSGGGEIIHALYMLMLAKAPYTLLKQAVYVHPTLTEGLFRLIESVKPVA